jgi:hypothetical protein
MKHWKTGDRVRIVEREQTAKDIKEQTYFPHFAGLVGDVVKVYGPDEVCVEIVRDSLPGSNASRHDEIEKRLKDRLMDSLSQDARSKLSEKEKQFTLRYTVLVSGADLEPYKGEVKARTRPAPMADERPHEADLEALEEQFLRERSGA